MIIFNVILSSQEKAEKISSYLIEQKYAMQTHVDNNTILNANGKRTTIRLFFMTKALLYKVIEDEIKKIFFSGEMLIYATPISHMNEEQVELLRSKLKAV